MIEITFSAETAEQLTAKLRATLNAWTPAAPRDALASNVEASKETPAETLPPPPPAHANGNGHAETAKVTTLKPAKEAKATKSSAKEPGEPPLTAADLRRALTAYISSNTQTQALELLQRFGHAQNVSGVDPSRYRAVYDAAMAGVVQ